MNALLAATLGLGCWLVVGCAVFAAIDSEDERLFKWAKSAPCFPLYMLVIVAWPYVTWRWLREETT